jgi:hypothetical protein
MLAHKLANPDNLLIFDVYILNDALRSENWLFVYIVLNSLSLPEAFEQPGYSLRQ